MPKLKKVSFKLPWGIGGIEFEPDRSQRLAAWELYVELVTRIATQPLDLDQGLLREALSSLHAMFGVTREVLRRHGPKVGAKKDSVGGIAIEVLNLGLRPFLAKWHPLLLSWEAQRPTDTAPREHERKWDQEATARGEMETLRGELTVYAEALKKIARV